jgi:hypothetical protein
MIEPTSKDIGRGVTYGGFEAELVGFDHHNLFLRFGSDRASAPVKRDDVEWSTNPGEVLKAALSRIDAAGIEAVDQGNKSFLVAGKFTLAANGAWSEVGAERRGYGVDTLIRAVRGEPVPLTKAAAESARVTTEH